MPITATPIDLRHIIVPDNLSDILQKGGKQETPTFNAVLSKHRKLAASLRRQAWPVASTVEPVSEPEDDEEVPDPHPGVETEPADVPAPEDPESTPEG